MKKVISLILSLVMVAALFAGCGASEAAPEKENTNDPTYTIAIIQQLDHSSLDEIRTAIEAQLKARAAENYRDIFTAQRNSLSSCSNP